MQTFGSLQRSRRWLVENGSHLLSRNHRKHIFPHLISPPSDKALHDGFPYIWDGYGAGVIKDRLNTDRVVSRGSRTRRRTDLGTCCRDLPFSSVDRFLTTPVTSAGLSRHHRKFYGIELYRQSMRKPTFLLVIVTIYGLLCGGCATGPRYTYTQQKDSASVAGPRVPDQGREDGTCYINIKKVDGLTANFPTSNPGSNRFFYSATKRLYLSPGQHRFILDISEINSDYGGVGHGAVGIVDTVVSGSAPTITVELKANHIYRFAAFLAGGTIELILWDETGGAKTRSEVANWTLDSNSNYSDSPAPSGARR